MKHNPRIVFWNSKSPGFAGFMVGVVIGTYVCKHLFYSVLPVIICSIACGIMGVMITSYGSKSNNS